MLLYLIVFKIKAFVNLRNNFIYTFYQLQFNINILRNTHTVITQTYTLKKNLQIHAFVHICTVILYEHITHESRYVWT